MARDLKNERAAEEFKLPDKYRIVAVQGDALEKLRAASRLSGLHPVAIEIAHELAKRVGDAGCAFMLETVELERAASAIELRLRGDLKRAAKGFLNTKVTVRSHLDRDAKRIVFWYEQKLTRAKRASDQ